VVKKEEEALLRPAVGVDLVQLPRVDKLRAVVQNIRTLQGIIENLDSYNNKSFFT
jgi:hypothetical protein